MTAKGLYRTATPESDSEYAVVEYGATSTLEEISRAQYASENFEPPFEELPSKEIFDAVRSH